jgi:hypothetical protein
MNNVKIAKEYAEGMAAFMAPGAKWVSTNHHMLARGERKAVEKEYRKIFSEVIVERHLLVCVK